MYFLRFTFTLNAALLSSEDDVMIRVERHFVGTHLEQRELVCQSYRLHHCVHPDVCVEPVPPGCECCQEMTTASVPLTHTSDNQIYRMRQWLLSLAILVHSVFFSPSLSYVCPHLFRIIRFMSGSNDDIYLSRSISLVLCLPLTEKRIFLSCSNCHSDISMFKP